MEERTMKAKKMVAAFLAMAAATALIAGCGGGDKKESSGGEKKFINIATGGTSGTYYPLGGRSKNADMEFGSGSFAFK